MRFSFSFLLLWLVLPATGLRAQAEPGTAGLPEPALTVREIVRRAAANDELRREHRLALEYDQTVTTERLDEGNQVFKTNSVRVVRREGQALAYADDAKIPANQTGDAKEAARLLAAVSLRKLIPRFQFALVAQAPVRGRACYVVRYSPRGTSSGGTREERVINRLSGRFWIDKTTFEILRGEGSLTEPVPVVLLASVARMDFTFSTQTLPGGEAGPADFSLDLAVKAPFYFYRQRQTNRLENWRPRRD